MTRIDLEYDADKWVIFFMHSYHLINGDKLHQLRVELRNEYFEKHGNNVDYGRDWELT